MTLSSQQWEALSNERKELQERGLLPEWYITQGWEMFKNKYAYKGEGKGVRGRFITIAKTLAKHMAGEEEKWESIFFDMLWEGRLSAASPVLANTGTDRGMNVSCSGQFVGDSVWDFYTELRETAVLSQHGFGTSGDFSSIRPRGAPISKGGKASGPVPVMEDFFTAASNISQGGNRRGSFAAYLDIDHPDWDEAIDGLMANPDGKNYGWTVRDSFIEKLKSGDKDAHRKFSKALYVKLVTGKGYFFFKDKANALRPQMYKDLGLEVEATNLCVAPETLVLTDKGHKEIQSMAGTKQRVWNGHEWSEVEIVKTGENQKLLKVTTNSGHVLECTPYHKWYVVRDYSGNVEEVRTKDLKPGDKLIRLSTEAIEGDLELSDAYVNGFYSADGCEVDGKNRVYLYGDKQKLVSEFETREDVYVQPNQDRIYFHVPELKPKYFVPGAEYSIESRLEWLAGYLDGDGTVARTGSSGTLQAASTNKEFLKEIQLMLQTLGVSSKVTKGREKGDYLLPDGRGGLKEYPCDEINRLLISGSGCVKLRELGIYFRRLEFDFINPNRNAERFVQVESIEDEGRISDTYCFTEPLRHMGVFNGILTGQCSEIMLHSSTEYTYSCILASMNLVHWDHLKESDDIFNATVFLDCVTEEFIQMSEGIPGLEKVREFTIKGRAIGLGAMGFHTYLQTKGIAFESLEAQFLANDMAKRIQAESLRASQYLAEMKGEPEWCKGYGVRNTHRTAYAPTKSSALLMGGVSESWSPDPGMVFEMASAVGELRRIPPVFYEKMKEKGVYNEDTIKDIINHSGSVQHVDWLTDEEKQVFRNAYEVDQFVILRHASQRQRHTCQGQSLNFFVADQGSEPLIAELISEVFKDPYILAQYYLYSKSGVVVPEDCVSCSA